MKPIVILEKPKNGKLFALTQRCLSAYGDVLSIQEQQISGGNPADFLLFGVKHPKDISLPGGLLLFEPGFRTGGAGCELKNLTPIIDFEDFKAAEFLKNKENPTVTIGASGRATLSIASLSRSQATISLQRKVYTLTGTEIEPCDFMVRHNGHLSLHLLLLLSAVLLLCDFSAGYDFSFLEKL